MADLVDRRLSVFSQATVFEDGTRGWNMTNTGSGQSYSEMS